MSSSVHVTELSRFVNPHQVVGNLSITIRVSSSDMSNRVCHEVITIVFLSLGGGLLLRLAKYDVLSWAPEVVESSSFISRDRWIPDVNFWSSQL